MNSYLYREKRVMGRMAALLGNASGAAYWTAGAEALLPRLRSMFYVPPAAAPTGDAAAADSGAFFQDRYFNGSAVPVRGAEGFAALFCGVATQEQADAVATTIGDPRLFALNFSLPTVSMNDLHFNTGSAVPNGPSDWEGATWLDQSWFAWQGLKDYGHLDLAEHIKTRVFMHGQGMRAGDQTPFGEYYNPITGERYGSRHFSWTSAHILLWAAEPVAVPFV